MYKITSVDIENDVLANRVTLFMSDGYELEIVVPVKLPKDASEVIAAIEYREKLEKIFTNNEIKSITYAHMEVPCCFGLLPIIKEAINSSGKKIPFEDITITIKGEKV